LAVAEPSGIPNPGKIWCAGLNYREHVQETGRQVTEQPVYFFRFGDSQVGHDGGIVLPPESEKLDYEGEIAVIVGKEGRRITTEDSWRHIAGYACYNDGSIRDWQLHTSQWGPGKNFWRTGGFGPWMVTSDEIPADTCMGLALARAMKSATLAASTPACIQKPAGMNPRRFTGVSCWGSEGSFDFRPGRSATLKESSMQ
jgi:2-keto-4-pentenoate hydratase/2-oxohepta-3-ene-1,7-dioic acid hydratase in catechol pathway